LNESPNSSKTVQIAHTKFDDSGNKVSTLSQVVSPVKTGKNQKKKIAKQKGNNLLPIKFTNTSKILTPMKVKPHRNYESFPLTSKAALRSGDLVSFKKLEMIKGKPTMQLFEAKIVNNDTKNNMVTIQIDESFLPDPNESNEAPPSLVTVGVDDLSEIRLIDASKTKKKKKKFIKKQTSNK